MKKRLVAVGLAGVLSLSLGACDVDPIDPVDPGLDDGGIPGETMPPPDDPAITPAP